MLNDFSGPGRSLISLAGLIAILIALGRRAAKPTKKRSVALFDPADG
jgi:hypothetical protein